MKTYLVKETLKYTGAELSSFFAEKSFSIKGNSIIAFCGPAEVNEEHMVDLEDLKNKDFIFSEDMVHFIVEIFDLNLERAVALQRLLITILHEKLQELKPEIKLKRNGDDLMDGQNKLTVSIATTSPISSLIHVGINVSSKNTPVPTKGLADYGIDPKAFAEKVLKAFQEEFLSMEHARTKVRQVP
ncbi:MAG: DUF366 family protein [Candidatus Margulisbacteria bacterium]|nr:DUF366 family protein [Candidatus Margulisiibacteriota bacterium]